jgi:tRNA U34 2-thiouridine synthase MnmA/TrmU
MVEAGPSRLESPNGLSDGLKSGLKTALKVRLKEPAVLTPGQSAVFYWSDMLIGGGIISTKGDTTPLH